MLESRNDGFKEASIQSTYYVIDFHEQPARRRYGRQTMKLGFIGLGNIGSVMAANLVKAGYSLIINDLRPEAGDNLVAAGAQWAGHPRAVSEASDTVITSLPGPPQVKSVMEGEQGVLSGLRSGCTWIDMSTTSEKEIKRLGAIAADKGAAVLEAPVTGGLALAKEGGITILVGGEKKVFEAQLPVLEVIGGKILHMGPLGSASVVKVITNLLALGHLILAGEAFMLGKKSGNRPDSAFRGYQGQLRQQLHHRDGVAAGLQRELSGRMRPAHHR
jgi:3-hydroxyisobutyrate dehydrogenase